MTSASGHEVSGYTSLEAELVGHRSWVVDLADCYDLNIYILPKLYVEILPSPPR
jgi:hypothetical protein